MLVLAAEGGANPLVGNLIWIAVMFAMLYFLLIRPQQKEQRERAEMIRSLKPGDKVLTNGGLIGVITKVDDLSIKIRVAERVEVEVIKTGVARKAQRLGSMETHPALDLRGDPIRACWPGLLFWRV